MLKIETYSDPEKMVTVWKITISDAEIISLDFTPKEREILDKCNEPSAPISMVALGLTLLARKIEQQAQAHGNSAIILPK